MSRGSLDQPDQSVSMVLSDEFGWYSCPVIDFAKGRLTIPAKSNNEGRYKVYKGKFQGGAKTLTGGNRTTDILTVELIAGVRLYLWMPSSFYCPQVACSI
jgi:hypothetical protein